MAARILGSFLLGLGVPMCRAGYYEPPDIDFSKVEFWPLSGGVDFGVGVTLTADGFRAGEDAVIDFVTANYDVAFRFQIDTVNKMIVRNAWSTGEDDWETPESTGGWPITDEQAPLTLKFYATMTKWAVTVNDVRMPWFDFNHRFTVDEVVYAAVHIGFVDGEVVDKRPECSTVCSAQECVNMAGASTCDGTCYSRISQENDNLVSTACLPSTTTGSDGSVCCDGRPLQHVDSDDSLVGSWVRVWSDSNLVKQAVTAYTGSDATASKLETASGNKVGIRSRHPVTGMYAVWVPQLYDTSDGLVDIPADVMEYTTLQTRLLNNENAANNAVIENNHGLITTAGSDPLFEQWWFLNMYDIRCRDALYVEGCGSVGDNPSNADSWWLSYSNLISSGQVEQGFAFYLTDEDVGHTPCRDEAAWTDSYAGNDNGDFANADCAVYEERGWCEDHGVATAAFEADHEPWSGAAVDARKLNREDVAPSGWNAAYMCCACGGGYHDAPTVQGHTILE